MSDTTQDSIKKDCGTKELFEKITHYYGIKRVKTHTIVQQLSETFSRGFRWRPDNGHLICYYGDYDSPFVQIDECNFTRAAGFILLMIKGVKIT